MEEAIRGRNCWLIGYLNVSESDLPEGGEKIDLGLATLYFNKPTSVTFTEKMIKLRDGSGRIILQISSESIMKLRLLQPVSLTGRKR